MKGVCLCQLFLALCFLAFSSGCLFTSKTRLNESQAQNRILSQQNAAQITEIENLKAHNRDMENKLIRAEESAALLKEQIDLDRRQLANYEREHAQWYEQFKALAREQAQAPDGTNPR
jgi:cell division protein FtsB